MDFWKKHNRDARRFFNARQYLHAINKYMLALERAYLLMDKNITHEASTKNFVTSLQGLCESYLQIGQHEYATSSLIKGHKLLQELIDIDSSDALNVKNYEKAKCQLESYIAYIISEYPEVHLCPHCYERIFRYPYNAMAEITIQ